MSDAIRTPSEPERVTTHRDAAANGSRLGFVDNLRWVMIVLVVSMHAAVTYSHLGSWYYMEAPEPGLPVKAAFAYYQMGLQAFFMGFLFLIAAYFVPGAVQRKGPPGFLRDRFVRLVVPALFYMLIVHPLIVNLLLRDYYHITQPFGTRYVEYIRTLRFFGNSGPMWFALALFLFSAVYAVWRAVFSSDVLKASDGPLPTDRQVVALILTMGTCTFMARIPWPIGSSILNMQLCFFSQYILLFAVGVIAWKRNWLLRIPREFGMKWFQRALTGGTLLWLGAISAILATHTDGKLVGGVTWQSAIISIWESFFCVGICLGLIVLFREKFNRQGQFARWMTENSFSVYLFHPPILIAVTLALSAATFPKPVKFIAATVIATVIAFCASAWFFRRVPLLRRIL